MPKYGGIGGQGKFPPLFINSYFDCSFLGGAVFFEAKDDITLRKVWKAHPTRKVVAGV